MIAFYYRTLMSSAEGLLSSVTADDSIGVAELGLGKCYDDAICLQEADLGFPASSEPARHPMTSPGFVPRA